MERNDSPVSVSEPTEHLAEARKMRRRIGPSNARHADWRPEIPAPSPAPELLLAMPDSEEGHMHARVLIAVTLLGFGSVGIGCGQGDPSRQSSTNAPDNYSIGLTVGAM